MVAVALGALVLNEELTPATLAGTACLTAAVAWTVRTTTGRPQKPRPGPPPPPGPSVSTASTASTAENSPSVSSVRSPR
jgi:hypothetical protein